MTWSLSRLAGQLTIPERLGVIALRAMVGWLFLVYVLAALLAPSILSGAPLLGRP
jgi:hypothetical protein